MDYASRRIVGKQKQWCPPPNGRLKINVDAAVDVKKQMTSLGVVVRDYKRICRAAVVKTSKFFGNVAMAEAAAIEWGLQVASRVGINFGIFESDSLEVIDLFNEKTSSMAEIKWMISEIQDNKQNFQNFKAQHISPLCNGIAHSLAELALQKKETVIWLDEFPMQIMYLFNEDQ